MGASPRSLDALDLHEIHFDGRVAPKKRYENADFATLGIQIIDEEEAMSTLELFAEILKEETAWEMEGK